MEGRGGERGRPSFQEQQATVRRNLSAREGYLPEKIETRESRLSSTTQSTRAETSRPVNIEPRKAAGLLAATEL